MNILDFNKKFLSKIDSEEQFTRMVLLSKALASGDGNIVRYFYKYVSPAFTNILSADEDQNSFFRNIRSDNAFVYIPLTKIIGTAYSKLVTSGGMKARVLDSAEKENKELTELLDEINNENRFTNKVWANAEYLQTTMGTVAVRLKIDPEVSKLPIQEVVQVENLEPIVRSSRIVGYKIKTRKSSDTQEFELQEIVRYKYTSGKRKIEVGFELYEVEGVNHKSLKKLELYNSEGELNKTDTQVKNVIKLFDIETLASKENVEKLTSLYNEIGDFPFIVIANDAKSSIHNRLGYGVPETYGIETIEDGISELASNLVEEIRKGKPKAFISEELIPKAANGDAGKFDPFRTSYETVKGVLTTDELFKFVQGNVNSDQFMNSVRNFFAMAANLANLSPITLGVTGLESIVASAESQQEREKTSIRSREERLTGWKNTLERLFKTQLKMALKIQGKNAAQVDNCEIKIEFGEYINPGEDAVIDTLRKAIDGGVISMRKAQENYFGETLSDEELNEVYIQTKIEKNMPLTPSEESSLGIARPEQSNTPVDETIIDEV